ncbi:MAG: immunoglobulin domain-containing protein, partial [Planctomycetota bacterium]
MDRHWFRHSRLGTGCLDTFARVAEFIRKCAARGIVVQLSVFDRAGIKCNNNNIGMFRDSPYNEANNDQTYLTCAGTYPNFIDLAPATIWDVNEAFINRLIAETGGYGNVIYEIMNEPHNSWNQQLIVDWHEDVADSLDTALNNYVPPGCDAPGSPTDAIVWDTFTCGTTPGASPNGRAAQEGGETWAAASYFVYDSTGAHVTQDGTNTRQAMTVPFNTSAGTGTVYRVEAILDARSAVNEWAGLGFSSSATGSFWSNGQVFALINPANGKCNIRITPNSTMQSANGDVPGGAARELKLALEYDSANQTATLYIDDVIVSHATDVQMPGGFSPDLAYAGVCLKGADASTKVDDIRIIIDSTSCAYVTSASVSPSAPVKYTGDNITFTVTTDGSSPYTYQWQEKVSSSWANVGTDSNQFTLTNVQQSMSGYQYRCLVSNGCTTNLVSNTATLTVNAILTYASIDLGTTDAPNGLVRVDNVVDGNTTGATNYSGHNCRKTVNSSVDHYMYFQVDDGFSNNGEITITIEYYDGNNSSLDLQIYNGSSYVTVDTIAGTNTDAWISGGTYVFTNAAFNTTPGADDFRIYKSSGYIILDLVDATVAEPVDPPTITQHPSPQNVNQGQAAQFTVVATGEGTLSYQWQKDGGNLSNGGDISGATSTTLQIANCVGADEGNYRCVVTNAGGSTNSNAAALTVTELPTITQHPANDVVDEGQTAQFTVAASGEGTLSYQWQKDGGNLSNGGDISGATSTTLQIANAETADEGNYRCVVSNAAGSVNSNTASLTVNLLCTPISITQHPTDKTVTEGGSTNFNVTAIGDAPQYQWEFSDNGTDWYNLGTNSSTLPVNNILLAWDGWLVRCTVSNSCPSSQTSNTAILTVNPACTSISITQHPTDQTVTEGGTVNFTVTAIGDAPQYQWEYSDNGTDWYNIGTNSSTLTVNNIVLAWDGWLV